MTAPIGLCVLYVKLTAKMLGAAHSNTLLQFSSFVSLMIMSFKLKRRQRNTPSPLKMWICTVRDNCAAVHNEYECSLHHLLESQNVKQVNKSAQSTKSLRADGCIHKSNFHKVTKKDTRSAKSPLCLILQQQWSLLLGPDTSHCLDTA